MYILSVIVTDNQWLSKYHHHLSVLQLRPTVYLISKVDWPLCIGQCYIGQEIWNIGKSLGISSKVLEKVQRSAVGDYMAEDLIKSMLTKWLNHKKGTGNKKRTWGTICTAIANECSQSQAYLILEQGM